LSAEETFEGFKVKSALSAIYLSSSVSGFKNASICRWPELQVSRPHAASEIATFFLSAPRLDAIGPGSYL
jgi:hypothetical protein